MALKHLSLALVTSSVGFPAGSAVRKLRAKAGDAGGSGSIPSREGPLEEEMQPTPVFLPGESHGRRSLAGYIHGVTKSWTRLSE